MTCIVGIETPGAVWLGSDSYVGDESWLDLMDRPKWTRHGSFVVATGGEVRPGTIIEAMKPRGRKRRGEDDVAFLSRAFLEPARQAIADAGATPLLKDFTALVVFNGRIYQIDADLGAYRSEYGYAATGSGFAYALGALSVTPDAPPEQRIRNALGAAEAHCAVVRQPFRIARVQT